MKGANMSEKTLEQWMEEVKQDGRLLRYVPEPLKTKEICFAAVQQNGQALKFVPEQLCTMSW